MIEIKNISKTYRTKKGLEVQALKNISLNFPNTGMVFILGKSGSGKSTLLNVVGGLDKYDSGEFIIKGKSSRDFTQADFDNYRNTLIGFIFQEYNILNEFTIGANIALALQLQGKKADSAMVNSILDEVDLTGLGNRKPNELSGGQKQRVAIARALIKNPDIIMADEPTGALDSTTGRQVFDTLKKLSKDKLVIIVSHDREFAEYYGDRVIELKDGEILSDITKYEAAADVKSEGIKIIDNRIMQLKKGYTLTDEDLEMIRKFIKNSESDSFLSLDNRTNESLKQNAMISDDGSKQSFKDTDNVEVAKNSTYNGYETIRSRLPFKHSLKIGLSSLKAKPIKLIITIILSMAAFGMFGVADIFASFNANTSMVNSLLNSKQEHISINTDNGLNTDKEMTDDFIFHINSRTGIKSKGVYAGNENSDLTISTFYDTSDYSIYYSHRMYGYIEMDNSDFADRNLMLTGRVAENFNEVVISKYLFESFQAYGYEGYNQQGDPITIKAEDIGDENNFISNKVMLNIDSTPYTVVGIVETKFESEKYSTLKDLSKQPNVEDDNYKLFLSMQSTVEYGYHSLGFFCPGTIANIRENSAFRNNNGNEAFSNSTTYSFAIGKMPTSRADMERFVEIAESNNKAERFNILTDFTFSIQSYGNLFNKNSTLFIYFGIGLGLFSALLLMNYISSSISYKKREIGILRAVGAKSTDVFGIFCCESMYIAIINAILAVLATLGVCIGLNAMVAKEIGTAITLVMINIRQIALISGVSILTAFLASLIPVLNISRKRPIDAILDK